MTFAIFFEKTFWFVIAMTGGLFALITKLGYKSILADCETRSLLSEKNLREDFKKEVKEIKDDFKKQIKEVRDEMKIEFERIDRHGKNGNEHQIMLLKSIIDKVNNLEKK